MVSRQIVFCGLVLGLLISCRRSADRGAVPVPQAKEEKAESPEPSTPSAPSPAIGPAEARLPDANPRGERQATANQWLEATPRGRRFLAELGDTVVRGTVKYVSSALRIDDPVETELIAAWFLWYAGIFPSTGPDTVEQLINSICVIRPGKAAGDPDTTVLVAEGKPYFRFTRVHAQTERPAAILTTSWVIQGKLFQAEQLLTYGPSGKWIPLKAKERRQHMDQGP